MTSEEEIIKSKQNLADYLLNTLSKKILLHLDFSKHLDDNIAWCGEYWQTIYNDEYSPSDKPLGLAALLSEQHLIVKTIKVQYFSIKDTSLEELYALILSEFLLEVHKNIKVVISAADFDKTNKLFIKRFAEYIANEEKIFKELSKYMDVVQVKKLVDKEKYNLVQIYMRELINAGFIKVWLAGIKVSEKMHLKNSLFFGEHVTIRPVEKFDYQTCKINYSFGGSFSKDYNFPSQDSAVVVEFIYIKNDNLKTVYLEAIQQIPSLFGLCSTYIKRLETIDIDLNYIEDSSHFYEEKKINSKSPFCLEISETNKNEFLIFIEEVLVRFFYSKYLNQGMPLAILLDKYHKLLITDYSNEEILIELTTCLEVLLISDKKGEINYKLKMRGAKIADLIGNLKSEEVLKAIDRVYDLRSKYLHSLEASEVLDQDFKILLDLLRTIFLVLIQCFYKEIRKEDKPHVEIKKHELINKLDEALYSSEKSKELTDTFKQKLSDKGYFLNGLPSPSLL